MWRGGCIFQVLNREEVPGDMLLVGVHERYRPSCSGTCYVETKSSDGEWGVGQGGGGSHEG